MATSPVMVTEEAGAGCTWTPLPEATGAMAAGVAAAANAAGGTAPW